MALHSIVDPDVFTSSTSDQNLCLNDWTYEKLEEISDNGIKINE